MRKDTKELKQQLADALGETGKDYWAKLCDYLSFKCTKEALDLVAIQVFTDPTQVKIHNNLLLAILHNLSPHVSNPVGIDSDFTIKNHKKRKGQDIMMGKHLKKRFNRKCALSLSASERTRINGLTMAPPFSTSDHGSGSFEYPKGVDGIPKTCVEDGDLPSPEHLRNRMAFICSFLGMDATFSNDAVLLLNQAVEVLIFLLTLAESFEEFLASRSKFDKRLKEMPKYQLEWKAETSNITEIKPQSDDFIWSFLLRCTKCFESTETAVNFKCHDESKIENSRGVANLVMKCKSCKNSGSLEIVKGSQKSFLADEIGFQSLIILEGRGWEPIEWIPDGKFSCRGIESNTIFQDILLTDDWCEYDEKAGESVEIMSLESRLSKYK